MTVQIGKSLSYDFPRRSQPNSDAFNARWDDIDRRLNQLEAFMPSWETLVTTATNDITSRIDTVLAPVAVQLQAVAELGFLTAQSGSTALMRVGDSPSFQLSFTGANLFNPSTFMMLERATVTTDYAIVRLIGYDKPNGVLQVQFLQIYGDPGPHNDWVFTDSPGITEVVRSLTTSAVAAQADVLTRQTDVISRQNDVATRQATTISASGSAVQAAVNAQGSATAAAASAASINGNNLIQRNGSVPFAATQSGVAPNPGDRSTALTTSAWVGVEITAAVNALVSGAPGALNTLKELADALNDDAAFSATVTAALNARLRFDAAQALSPAQKAQGLANLGAVQQGGAPDQGPNLIHLGQSLSGLGLIAQVDNTPLGKVWNDSVAQSVIGPTGYQMLPSGLIMQWTNAVLPPNPWTFPIPFPNACFVVLGNSQPANAQCALMFPSVTKTGTTITARNGNNTNLPGIPASLFALGY